MDKENKNNQPFVSSASPYSAILESITYVNNICCSVSAAPYAYTLFMLFTLWFERKQHIRVHTFAYVVYVCNTLQNGTIGWRGGDKLLNKVVILVFIVHKKFSRRFVKLQLTHWCHKDYFNDLLATFQSLNCVRTLAVYGGAESSCNASNIC